MEARGCRSDGLHVCWAILALFAAPLQADIAFDVPVAFPAGNQPEAIASGDLDGDGDTDLALANVGNHTVSILFNNGLGAFSVASTVSVGFRPVSIAVADLDGDLDLDLAVANQNSNTISVLLNNGSGGFPTHVQYPAGTSPRFAAAADVDGDHDPDLVAVLTSSAAVSVLVNQGNATFASPVTFPAGGFGESVAAGDLDGDLDTDLAVAHSNGISVLKNNGAGAYLAPATFPAAERPASVAIADLDSDGDADLATANARSGSNFLTRSVSVLLNDGTGSFAAPTSYSTGDEFTSGRAVATGDIDGDGKPDLVVVNGPPTNSNVSILINGGAGTFAPPLNLVAPMSAVLSFPVDDAALADLNGDGRLDIAASGATPSGSFSGVMLAFNQPNLALFGGATDLPSGTGLVSVASADLNGDGAPDLALIDQGSKELAVHFNNGNGTFSGPVSYAAGVFPTSVTAGDFDGDGDTDFVTADADNSTDAVRVHWNDSSGAFPTSKLIPLGGPFFNNPGHVTGADLDGDGDLDIVTANTGGSSVKIIKNLGGGNFAAPVMYSAGTNPAEAHVGDLDGDGDLDIAVASRGNFASILLNHGDGTFAPQGYVSIGFDQWSLALADLDGDSDLDLAVALNSTGSAGVARNNGNGSFQPATTFFAGTGLVSKVVASDFDNDGDVDLAFASYSASNVTVLLNDGAGSFGRPVAYAPNRNPRGLAASDLDGDGDFDLAAANVTSGSVSLFLNKTINIPVAVHLASFEARAAGNSAVLTWRYVSDDAVRGVRIYRRRWTDADAVVLNGGRLVPPGEERFVDRTVRSGAAYQYALGFVDWKGGETVSPWVHVSILSMGPVLLQNVPNPFNPSTTIQFHLPERGPVVLAVYDARGKLVATLVDEIRPEGLNEIRWGGRNADGELVGTGIYFYRLEVGGRVLSRKLVVIK